MSLSVVLCCLSFWLCCLSCFEFWVCGLLLVLGCGLGVRVFGGIYVAKIDKMSMPTSAYFCHLSLSDKVQT